MSDHCLVLSVAQSVLLLNFAQIVGFVKVDRLISLSCYMDLSKSIHVFLYVYMGFVRIDTGIRQKLNMDFVL